MGTDIHLAVERRMNGKWHRVHPPVEARDPWLVEQAAKDDDDGYYRKRSEVVWYEDRNYKCFSILADVRNGFGVAGCDTGDGFIPISKPRGIPDDLSDELRSEDPYEWDLGDHSFSWLTLQELLDYDWSRTTKHRGVIKFDDFLERVKNNDTSWPQSYSGGIFGQGILTITRAEALQQMQGQGLAVHKDVELYVQEEWESTYAEAAGRFYSEVLDHLKNVDPDPNNVRIVFGFDS